MLGVFIGTRVFFGMLRNSLFNDGGTWSKCVLGQSGFEHLERE
jgi:hypothetical protein